MSFPNTVAIYIIFFPQSLSALRESGKCTELRGKATWRRRRRMYPVPGEGWPGIEAEVMNLVARWQQLPMQLR